MAKGQTLWNTEEIQDSVTLTMAEPKKFKACVNVVKNDIDDGRLKDILKFLEKWLKNKAIVLKSPEGEVVHHPNIENYFELKKLKKENIYEFVGVFLCDKGNIRQMVGQSPAFVQQLIERLLKCYYVPANDFYKEEHGPDILKKPTGWYSPRYSLNYPWFSVFYMYLPGEYFEEPMPFLTLGRTLFRFFQEAYTEVPVLIRKDISKEEGLKVLETETSVVTNYPVLNNLFQQGILTVGASDKMLVSTVRKCAKMVTLDEFFPESKDLFLKNLRASFALPFFFELFFYAKMKEAMPFEKLLKKFAPDIFTLENLLYVNIPHVKWTHTRYNNLSCYQYLLDLIWKILSVKELSGCWLSVRSLLYEILSQNGGFESVHLFSNYEYNESNFRMENKRFAQERIHYGNLRTELIEPGLKGCLVSLAAVGILDVAYRDYDAADRSWVDWLEYVRLTDLGRYVLGHTKTYEKKQLEQTNSFEVDEERLIVRCLPGGLSFDNFLQEVATPIGRHRYVFSETVFLQKCASMQIARQKIDFLKQFIVTHPSPLWEDFFHNILNRCYPLNEMSDGLYTIYKLLPSRQDMIHLLSTDAKLKELVIRAEGYLILVKNTNKEKFLRRMKTLGYLL